MNDMKGSQYYDLFNYVELSRIRKSKAELFADKMVKVTLCLQILEDYRRWA